MYLGLAVSLIFDQHSARDETVRLCRPVFQLLPDLDHFVEDNNLAPLVRDSLIAHLHVGRSEVVNADTKAEFFHADAVYHFVSSCAITVGMYGDVTWLWRMGSSGYLVTS